MGRPKKPTSVVRTRSFSQEIQNVYNSDDWHSFFDLINYFKETVKEPARRDLLIRAAEDAIGGTFGAGGKKEGVETELDFILKHLRRSVHSWLKLKKPVYYVKDEKTGRKSKPVTVYNILSPAHAADIVQMSVIKLIESGKYNLTIPRNAKVKFIKTVALQVTLDEVRKLRSEPITNASELDVVDQVSLRRASPNTADE